MAEDLSPIPRKELIVAMHSHLKAFLNTDLAQMDRALWDLEAGQEHFRVRRELCEWNKIESYQKQVIEPALAQIAPFELFGKDNGVAKQSILFSPLTNLQNRKKETNRDTFVSHIICIGFALVNFADVELILPDVLKVASDLGFLGIEKMDERQSPKTKDAIRELMQRGIDLNKNRMHWVNAIEELNFDGFIPFPPKAETV